MAIQVREVCLFRDESGGLGLSLKGGADCGLPVFISKMPPNLPASNSGKLFIGDAILKVKYQWYICICVCILHDYESDDSEVTRFGVKCVLHSFISEQQ